MLGDDAGMAAPHPSAAAAALAALRSTLASKHDELSHEIERNQELRLELLRFYVVWRCLREICAHCAVHRSRSARSSTVCGS